SAFKFSESATSCLQALKSPPSSRTSPILMIIFKVFIRFYFSNLFLISRILLVQILTYPNLCFWNRQVLVLIRYKLCSSIIRSTRPFRMIISVHSLLCYAPTHQIKKTFVFHSQFQPSLPSERFPGN